MKMHRSAVGTFCLLSLASAAVFSACAINQRVVPAPIGTTISTVFIENNPAVLMNGLAGEIQSQVRAMGYGAELYTGERPKEAVHCLKFTANWQWDMAMYLTFFHATLFEDDRVLGNADYDSRKGGGNLGKFGHTAEKIRPLLRELFKNALSTQPRVTPMGDKP